MNTKKLLVIGLAWPEPTATAAGVRMMQLLKTFKKYGYHTTFVSSALQTNTTADLNALGVTTLTVQLNSSSFDALIADSAPDVVLFDRFLTEEQFGWRVAEHCPKAIRILDTEDLHSLRHAREKCLKNDIPFTSDIWLGEEKTKREIASIYRCDFSLIVSSFEMELLQNVVNMDDNLLMHLPFMLDVNGIGHEWPSFEARQDFIFIGGGKHAPNIGAIRHLERKIWPGIHASLPPAKCHIYGSYLPQDIKRLHQPKKGFYVHGRAAEVSEVMMKARVCLAPLQFGAGIKGKLTEAMLHGTPSVTTSIGAEGMHGALPWNGYIEDDDTLFVQKSVELYTLKEKWQRAQANGSVIINTLYNRETLEAILFKKITYLNRHLEQHRRRNFLGRLLEHQTLLATKYMSKWIEEKNKHRERN